MINILTDMAEVAALRQSEHKQIKSTYYSTVNGSIKAKVNLEV